MLKFPTVSDVQQRYVPECFHPRRKPEGNRKGDGKRKKRQMWKVIKMGEKKQERPGIWTEEDTKDQREEKHGDGKQR